MKTLNQFEIRIRDLSETMEKCHTIEAKLVLADMIKDVIAEGIAYARQEMESAAGLLSQDYLKQNAAYDQAAVQQQYLNAAQQQRNAAQQQSYVGMFSGKGIFGQQIY